MEWKDKALVLSVRRHGETSVITEVMTHLHGRHLGLVRQGRSQRQQAILQPGNFVSLTWRARLEEQLGIFQIEPLSLYASTHLSSALVLHGLAYIGALLRLLPERDPHPHVFEQLTALIHHLHLPEISAPNVVRFELFLLQELGFGLDLQRCVATGARDDLVFVSPKSGRAVSRQAGLPYQNRLLVLPPFLLGEHDLIPANWQEIRSGFELAEYFLKRDIFLPRHLAFPSSRQAYLERIERLEREELHSGMIGAC